MDLKFTMTRWIESLDFFRRSNLSLFTLVTLNTTLRTIKLIINLFWWLYVLSLATSLHCPLTFPWLIHCAVRMILLYLVIMSLRPSLERKDYHYYFVYLSEFWVVVLVASMGIKCLDQSIISLFLVPTLTFFFFYFDGIDKPFAITLRRTGRALWYFLPIYLVLTLLTVLASWLGTSIGHGLQAIAGYTLPCPCITAFWHAVIGTLIPCIISDVLMLVVMAAIVVYYIKNKHAHFQLLFD